MSHETARLLSYALVWTLLVQLARASGVFEVNLHSLVDAFGRDLRRDCCAWQNNTHPNLHNHHHHHHHHPNQLNPQQAQPQACDPTKCQLIIRICVKNYQTQIDPSQCTFGELSAQVTKPHELVPLAGLYPQHFARLQPKLQHQAAANIHLQRMLSQQAAGSQQWLPGGQPRALRTVAFDEPITFPFNFTWPGAFSLIVDAWYESAATGVQQVALPRASAAASASASATFDLFRRQPIIKHSMHGWLAVKNEWTSDVHKTDAATLTYSYRVTCQQHYFGDQCNILCRPRDDLYGHYTCGQQGEVTCLAGWTGSYCLEPICSPGCQGNCSRPNECSCRQGWQGGQCEQCVRYPGCVHGSCSRPFECICDQGWGGLLCNEDLNFCAHHQPCRNGALCSNTFDASGMGSYTCACEEGYAGKNCERKLQAAAPALPAVLLGPAQNGSSNIGAKPAAASATNSSSSSGGRAKQQAASAKPAPRYTSGQDEDLELGPLVEFGYPRHSLLQHHQQQPSIPLDHWVVAAYATIMGCMLVLVVLFLVKAYVQSRAGARQRPGDATDGAGRHASSRRHLRYQEQWAHEAGQVEDHVAAMQNHQNIYKSRSSLAAAGADTKTPFEDDSSASSSSDSPAALGSSNVMARGRAYSYYNLPAQTQYQAYQSAHAYASSAANLRSQHHLSQRNLQQVATTVSSGLGPQIPPPPYTCSHSHPNTIYSGSQSHYGASIYNHPSGVSTATIGSSSTSKTGKSQLSAATTTSSLYGQSGGAATAAAAEQQDPYGTTRTGQPTTTSATTGQNQQQQQQQQQNVIYGENTTNSTYQSPFYVIHYFMGDRQEQ